MAENRTGGLRLERGTGLVIGLGNTPPLEQGGATESARHVLEAIVRDALERPPCLVSFSGGRDSSAVLALASHVARRDGLELPVPVSMTFPHCDSADETDWQELVVRHLGLPNWERPTFADELDIVGPVAASVLRAHGLLWPFNAFFHVPIFDRARGGTVLSGVGGDEVFSSGWTWSRENRVLRRDARPKPLDPVRIGVALAPMPVRAAFLSLRARARPAAVYPAWLRPDAIAGITAARARVAAEESLSYSRCVRRVLWRARSRLVGTQSMRDLAEERGVEYNAPFFDGRFLSALAAERSWRMFDSRSAAMDDLFGDLLPVPLRDRASKASFNAVFFNRYARAFAAQWDGSGVDANYVDPLALRREWLSETDPDARTYGLLQAAWLAQAQLGTDN